MQNHTFSIGRQENTIHFLFCNFVANVWKRGFTTVFLLTQYLIISSILLSSIWGSDHKGGTLECKLAVSRIFLGNMVRKKNRACYLSSDCSIIWSSISQVFCSGFIGNGHKVTGKVPLFLKWNDWKAFFL